MTNRVYLLIILLLSAGAAGFAQDRPIGYWRAHLPYNSAVGVATDGNTLFTASSEAFFTFKGINGSGIPSAYSKVEGMSDVRMKCVAYDVTTSTVVLVYENGNIDLFKENENTFYNVPDFKIKGISGDKSVNGLYVENGVAYISTSVSILVLDLTTHNIDENYQFIINNEVTPIYGFTGYGNYFYAVTSGGVFRAEKNNPQLQNFQVWQTVDTGSGFRYAASVNNELYMATLQSIYKLVNDTLHKIYTCPSTNAVRHIDSGLTSLLVCEYNAATFGGAVKLLSPSGSVNDTVNMDDVRQAVQLADSSIWVAAFYSGLRKINMPSKSVETHVPQGPSNVGAFDIYAHNKEVWVAHGGYSDQLFALPSFSGASRFTPAGWEFYKKYYYSPMDNFDDIVKVTKDETDGTVYFGSFQDGLLIKKSDGSGELLNGYNSIFDSSVSYFGNGQRQVTGLAIDHSHNLWVSTLNAQTNLYLRTSDGNWQKMIRAAGFNGGHVLVDDNGQVWMSSLAGSGLMVYDPKGTYDDQSDDAVYRLTTGVGTGNLPGSKVYSIAKDRNNNIWVGTENGIGIVSNCYAPDPCDAQIPIVQYDKFAGYLFAGSIVHAIAVDGGNRKWVGTDAGVWLLSPNADKIVYRFTAENSPLPSNHIRKIAIDDITGDVYIGTDDGMVSYRSTAVEGGPTNENVQVFPNPVNSGYSGTIAIKGLVANADVRITDINGQLVYRTTAYGGQAVWNGRDYTGHRPQTGIYLVFVTSADGGQVYTAKIAFVQ